MTERTERPVPAAGGPEPAGDRSLRILLISGSTRAASTNLAVLRTVRQIAPDGVAAEVYQNLSGLPAFNPDNDGADAGPAVADLRRQLAGADAVLLCTPEYAGTLPGSLKNLLDWTVGTGDLYGKPVAWINAAHAGRGGGAQATLAMVLDYVGAVPIQAACLALPGAREAVGPDGLIGDVGIRGLLAGSVEQIVRHVRARASRSR
jgi:chromate reductase, NAD(P)H dehydrogenase (quinone)